MKLKDYIQSLQKLEKKYPNAIVIYSTDDEGNSFNKVTYTPTVGYFNKVDGEFITNETDDRYLKPNAICIN